jgi:putative Mg2+ transporter-C (MgtC) family protein
VFLGRLQRFIMMHARNLNLLVEFTHIDDVGKIISAIKAQDIRIFDVDIHKSKGAGALPSAVFSVRLPQKMSHTALLTLLAGVENVRTIEEL